MDSATAIDQGQADLSLIVRPDMRQYALLDHLLAFKQMPLRTLGLSAEQVKTLPRAQLAALPLVQPSWLPPRPNFAAAGQPWNGSMAQCCGCIPFSSRTKPKLRA